MLVFRFAEFAFVVADGFDGVDAFFAYEPAMMCSVLLMQASIICRQSKFEGPKVSGGRVPSIYNAGHYPRRGGSLSGGEPANRTPD